MSISNNTLAVVGAKYLALHDADNEVRSLRSALESAIKKRDEARGALMRAQRQHENDDGAKTCIA